MNYSDTITFVANSLAKKFSEVYHSAEIINIFEAGKIVDRFPAINKDGEWIPLSPTDVKDTIYIRRIGDDTVNQEARLGSCMKSYVMNGQLRIVYFNMNGDSARSMFDLLQSVLIQGVKVVRVVRDKFKLLQDESTGEYNFSPKTVYLAVDITIYWDLFPDTCEQDFCVSVDNPIKKCAPIIQES